jgi:PAS domain S-box-containing protein
MFRGSWSQRERLTVNDPIRILHLEDNPIDAELIRSVLNSEGIVAEVIQVQTRPEFEVALERPVDLILSDFALPSFDGMAALEIARRKCPQVPFILVSGTIGEEAAVDSLKEGAADYVLKDRLSRLPAAVRRAMREGEERAARQRIEEELRQRNELFRQITENVDDLVAVLDLDGRRIFNSPSYRNLFGNPQALVGADSFADIHPEDRERIKGIFKETARTGVGHRTEFRFLLPDGTNRHIESQGSVIRDKDGKVTNVVVVSRDVTERKRVEEELVAAETKFRTLVEQSIVGIYIIEGETFVYVNPKMAEVLGYPVEELLSRPVLAVIVEEDRPLVERNIQERLRGRMRDARYELRMRRKDGRVIHAEVHGTVTEYAGKPAILGTLLDITERKQAEARVREQAALLDEARDAIFVRDLDQRVTYWNKGAERLYGWTAEEILGKRASEILYKEDAPRRDEIWKAVVEKGEWTGELKQITKSGQGIVIVSRRTLLRDAQDKPTAVLNINTDVTEKKQLEEKFLRAQRLESIGALAGGIAHDLNNVLAPVLMAAELLQDELSSDMGKNMLEMIRVSANRGGDMVKQILSFARGVSGEPIVLQLRHLIKDMAKLVQDTFPRSIGVQTRAGNDLQPILADATQLHQVLLNLCVNGRDAMPNGGTLLIEAENLVLNNKSFRGVERPVSGPFVLLAVSDTGTGIPPELMDKIFEPFFTTKEQGKGTGLGLSTVIGIVKNHGGFLEVNSEVGKGTSFRIYLPATTKAAQEPAGAHAVELPEGRGEQILLVDDELALLEMTKETLETYGYRVLAASHGAEALLIYQQHRNEIAAVITDIMMPVMDGPAFVRTLRSLNPEVKIICVSGLASEHKLGQIDQTQVRSFVTKPYTSATLLATLRQVITAD